MPPSPSSRVRLRAPRLILTIAIVVALVGLGSRMSGQTTRTGWTVVAWNNLGMHCMDADFSVFSILPPYNTIQAQVVNAEGKLVKSASGISLTYEAVADASLSINKTSAGKTNFWQYVSTLFGASLPVDAGLAGSDMPGASNPPQPMTFDPALNWFKAEGIPITPYDDAGNKNYYPMMQVTAKNSSGTVLASTRIVLPVSDEMDCSSCHVDSGPARRCPRPEGCTTPIRSATSGSTFCSATTRSISAMPPTRPPWQRGATSARGSTDGHGLQRRKPTLCAHCHLSEALPGTGYPSIKPLTAAMHAGHAAATDPTNGMTLDSADNRSACYRCHPGSETKCLRGTMGNSVAADGSMAIQCQNCHGHMSDVGALDRTGWLDEPTCQQCHSGTATNNNGQIRYTSVFEPSGQAREAVNLTFATSHDTPMAGKSLYRFSAGHGGLQCSACHGSTHAEYPSSHANDNVQSVALQGHVGTIAECGTCHTEVPYDDLRRTARHAPRRRPLGHESQRRGRRQPEQCQACHGLDYRGTVLSRAFGPGR